MVLLRFAPSPTGSLHLGGLRTALLNHIYVKKLSGKWILRIEDTDSTRFVEGSVDDIRKSLEWAGLEYDYGPGKGGPHQPYFQSERRDLYLSYTKRLLDSGHAYRCFCSQGRLASTRDRLTKTGSNATYDKACLRLSEEEVARRVRNGEKSVIRINDGAIPKRPTPPDMIFGTLKDAHSSLPTDPVLLKSDLFPTYHLASIVDDHEMGITHVLRGEEWLPSLPLHLDLYACLSITPPAFAHLPLLLNADGSKMSKRKGDVRVADFIAGGWEPGAVLNWLALAGWGASPNSPSGKSQAPSSTKMFDLPELIEKFDLSSLTSRRSILDTGKLEYLNKRHILKQCQNATGLASLAKRAERLARAQFFASAQLDQCNFAALILSLGERLVNLNDFPALVSFLFQEPDYRSEEAQTLKALLSNESYLRVLHDVISKGSQASLTWDESSLRGLLKDLNHQSGLKQKDFMSILRHALTAKQSGLGVASILHLLGRDRAIARLKRVVDMMREADKPNCAPLPKSADLP